jgi:hypothetical protein
MYLQGSLHHLRRRRHRRRHRHRHRQQSLILELGKQVRLYMHFQQQNQMKK